MTSTEFSIVFGEHVQSLNYEDALRLSISVCKKLFPDYSDFVSIENWGDRDILIDAINEVEALLNGAVSYERIKEFHRLVDLAVPDTEDFPEVSSSYALNSACAVLETLEYVIDRDLKHICSIGTYLTDTIDLRIHELGIESEEEIGRHPLMIETRRFLLGAS